MPLPEKIAKDCAEQVRRELALITGTPQGGRHVTCEGCPDNDDCEFVWDLYNTDGDCLAIK